MKSKIHALAAVFGILTALSAHAYVITDATNGANSYWGGDAHGYGDVIEGAGDHSYDINSASVSRLDNILTIKISTNFAGHAGQDTWAATHGIGYGDVFLASDWNPFGTDAHHQSDNASNGTHWSYGLSLDNRWSNTGGTFTLYALNGSSNASNVLLSDNFLSCALYTQCLYRNGEAVAVNTRSNTVADTGITGTWTVNPNSDLVFTLNVSGTNLNSYADLALHWGETCQNDVIEGVGVVPEPATFALLCMGLAGLAFGRRRQKSRISR